MDALPIHLTARDVETLDALLRVGLAAGLFGLLALVALALFVLALTRRR